MIIIASLGVGAMPRVASALGAITAAVVGVIANLTLWFALHVLFNTLTRVSMGPAILPCLIGQVSNQSP